MIIRFKVDAQEHLNYQLFGVGLSKSIMRKSRRNRWIVPIGFVALAIIGWKYDLGYLGAIYILFGALWFLFYPKYNSWVIKRNFENYVKENFTEDDFNDEREVFITDTEVSGKTRLGESTFPIASITKIIEVPTAFYAMLPTAQAFVVPKEYVNVDEVREKLKGLVPYEDRNDWVWK